MSNIFKIPENTNVGRIILMHYDLSEDSLSSVFTHLPELGNGYPNYLNRPMRAKKRNRIPKYELAYKWTTPNEVLTLKDRDNERR